MGERPAMSVVVMGYRDAATIVRAVGSVVGQADVRTEVVVVTSGGDDSAARVHRAFPDLTVVDVPGRLMPGGARNAGVEASRGAVVAFLAADCVAEPGWVDGRRARHEEGRPVVASAMANLERRRLAAWGFHFGVYAHRLAGRAAGPIRGDDGGAHGCSFARAVLERAGGFSPHLRVGEDTEMSGALDRLGVPIWYEPSVRTAHAGPRTTVAMLRDRYERGRRRAGVRGAFAGTWRALVRRLAREQRRAVRRAFRDAGPDRRWLVASLPWMVAGSVAAAVGQQRAAGHRRSDG